jgi:hypothetical protein
MKATEPVSLAAVLGICWERLSELPGSRRLAAQLAG